MKGTAVVSPPRAPRILWLHECVWLNINGYDIFQTGRVAFCTLSEKVTKMPHTERTQAAFLTQLSLVYGANDDCHTATCLSHLSD